MTLCFFWVIGVLIMLFIELLKATWWVIILVVIISFLLAHSDEVVPIVKKYWQKFFIALGALSILGICIWLPVKYIRSNKTEQISIDSLAIDTAKAEPIDTAQIMADQRKDSIFTGNIFAGLRFGISKSEYERAIRRYKSEYGSRLYVPSDSGGYEAYEIGRIEPMFWHNKLYNVKIRLPYIAYYELDKMLENKYGITKHRTWTWRNVEINLVLSSNTPYDRSGDKGYGSSFSGWYYEYPGSKRLTREPGKTYLEYKDLTLYKLERQETHRRDSIRQAKEAEARMRETQREQAKANKYKDNI